jgi:hypothetical protein
VKIDAIEYELSKSIHQKLLILIIETTVTASPLAKGAGGLRDWFTVERYCITFLTFLLAVRELNPLDPLFLRGRGFELT